MTIFMQFKGKELKATAKKTASGRKNVKKNDCQKKPHLAGKKTSKMTAKKMNLAEKKHQKMTSKKTVSGSKKTL